ncbi:PD-(D/E)XK nuclease family protein [Alkalinema sp. FACHB-956]|uniref:PDDEXK-like family protein n=1 Tax=Alkalinema sp. FACHB-956 TaxID=2692768 RepID=UPI0016838E5F|nr:PD-(D/E)XK nuclease family protein [Alkalinema sp. FACHB-956]MBD2328280.1 PD-(D/E)XK nuclease family protein [Alkalinema sp. FACHB-956]
MINPKDYSLLEDLVIHNPDLDLLESKLSSFNIFEAVGMTRQEIRHSYFLAFLLNPSESHYFGDLFLKRFLITTLRSLDNPPISAIAINVANLEDAEVKREYKNIDILIYSPNEKIVVAIENKVDSGEHDNQLNRYQTIIQHDFPNYRTVFIYLTKEGNAPSNQAWYPVSYELIAQCIDGLCEQYAAKINDDVRRLMTHYSNLLKRHIMSDSEIAQLCRKIYKQHRQALDLIYEHRPDFQSEISDFLQQMIEDNQEHNIVKDDSVKKMIRFALQEWDELDFQKTCQGWTSSGRMILFQFWNVPDYLGLGLCIGPGDEHLKRSIYDLIKQLEIRGIKKSKIKASGWNELFAVQILGASDYEDGDLEEIQRKISDFFQNFLKTDLQTIRQINLKSIHPQVDRIYLQNLPS